MFHFKRNVEVPFAGTSGTVTILEHLRNVYGGDKPKKLKIGIGRKRGKEKQENKREEEEMLVEEEEKNKKKKERKGRSLTQLWKLL